MLLRELLCTFDPKTEVALYGSMDDKAPFATGPVETLRYFAIEWHVGKSVQQIKVNKNIVYIYLYASTASIGYGCTTLPGKAAYTATNTAGSTTIVGTPKNE